MRKKVTTNARERRESAPPDEPHTPVEVSYELWQSWKAEDRRQLREAFAADPQLAAEFWAKWGTCQIVIDWDSIEPLEDYPPEDSPE